VSLSSHIQERLLTLDRGTGTAALKRLVLASGAEWYRDNPAERARLRDNLTAFGLPGDERMVDAAASNVMLHYYEKLLPLFCAPDAYASYLREHVSAGDALAALAEAHRAGTASLVAVSHFGAVELVTPTLALHGLPVSAVLRFTTPQLSEAAAEQARRFADSGRFAPVRFIEVGKPGVVAAMEMAAVVRRGGVLVSVFDERTEYSVPVSLLGRAVWGGAGLDRLMRLAGGRQRLCAAFMERTGDETYRLTTQEITGTDTPVQALVERLERMVRSHPEQWYFLHEKIPFVES